MESATIKQGDTLTWLARPNALDAGDPIDGDWTCKAGLFATAGAAIIPAYTVTDKHDIDGSEYYLVALTRAQTAALAPGVFLLVVDIRNDTTTPPYSQESVINVLVESQYIA